MFHYGKFLVLTTLAVSMACLGARAQREQENDRRTESRPEPRSAVTSARPVEASDLAKDNL